MTKTGNLFDTHPNIYKDWVVGSFVEDPEFQSENFEFKFQRGKKGHIREPKPVINPDTNTLAILIYGKVRIKMINNDSVYLLAEGDYFKWEPDEPHEFEFLEDTLVITLRW